MLRRSLPEIVVDGNRMKSIREALDRLEYTAIPGAEYLQFVKQLAGAGLSRSTC
jgi:hypothetical protein